MRIISVRLLVVFGLIGLGISGSQAFAQNEAQFPVRQAPGFRGRIRFCWQGWE